MNRKLLVFVALGVALVALPLVARFGRGDSAMASSRIGADEMTFFAV
mgnify:CR=1 FL=1